MSTYYRYFVEIEEAFVRRRGGHLLLSPKDWALIESWKQTGVPLDIVLLGIERTFNSNKAGSNQRMINSLAYCRREIETQFNEWRKRQV